MVGVIVEKAYFFTGFDNKRYCLDINTSSVFMVDKLMELIITGVSTDKLINLYDKDMIKSYQDNLYTFKQNGFFSDDIPHESLSKICSDTGYLSSASFMISNNYNFGCKYPFSIN
jgi:hypothetical protein